MRLYIAVVESWKRKGRRVKIAVHCRSKAAAKKMVRDRFAKWSLVVLKHATGPHCICFQDEYPDEDPDDVPTLAGASSP